MTEIAEAPKRLERSYTEAEIQRALVEVAACSGNTALAARNLEADDDAPPVGQKTLWEWSRRKYLQQYEAIRAKALPKLMEHAADQHMALAQRQMEGAAKLTDELISESAQLDPKDKVNALGKLDIGSGIHTERARDLSDQQAPKAERTVEELLRGLAGRGLELGERVTEGDRVVERVARVDSGSSALDVRSDDVDVPASS